MGESIPMPLVLAIAAGCSLAWLGLMTRAARTVPTKEKTVPTPMPLNDVILPGAPSHPGVADDYPNAWDRYLSLAGVQAPRRRQAVYRPRDRRAAAYKEAVRGRAPRATPTPDRSTALLDSSQPVDYYVLFGIGRTATSEQIEAAYRQYVRAIHPDRFYGDPRRHTRAQAKLLEANIAIGVLRDARRRAQYDASL